MASEYDVLTFFCEECGAYCPQGNSLRENGQYLCDDCNEPDEEVDWLDDKTPRPCGCSHDGPSAQCEEGTRLYNAIPVFPDFEADGSRYHLSEADYERTTDLIFAWEEHLGMPIAQEH